jgi:hypothetical protein
MVCDHNFSTFMPGEKECIFNKIYAILADLFLNMRHYGLIGNKLT